MSEEKMSIKPTRFANLQVGDKLLYMAGRGDYHAEAEVTVTKDTDYTNTGCFVRLDRILTAGNAVKLEEGQVIIAGRSELYRREAQDAK